MTLQLSKPETGMNLTPLEIVAELDKHIIGQHKAKRSVAVALRNHYRQAATFRNHASRGDA